MVHAVGIVVMLVVLGTAVATFAGRWGIPAPSLLVLAGIVVALVPGVPAIHVAPDVIALVVLPPLLYASAEEISARDLRRVWVPVTVLALGLVLATAAVIASLALALTALSGAMAFVLGAVLASTDPVAVTALGRRLSLPARIQVLVQSESLFNDATSLVLFKVAVAAVVAGGSVSLAGAAGRFLLLAGGGIAVGLALAASVALVRTRTTDPVLDTVIALVAPYAAYLLAESVDVSGVTAVVVAGVAAGSLGHRVSDARTRLHVQTVYAVVVFGLESVVFALIGLELPTLVRDLGPGNSWWPGQAAVLAAALIGIRMLWVWPTTAWAGPTRRYPTWPLVRVVTWSGTRGVMPLAAALSIPLVAADGTPLPGRGLVLVLTTAVVAATLTVQGLSLAGMVKTSGLAVATEHAAAKEQAALAAMNEAAVAYLDELAAVGAVNAVAVERLRQRYAERLDPQTDAGLLDDLAALRRDVLSVQSEELRRLSAQEQISDGMRRRLQADLDRREAGLDA
ncbi:sodium/hydrogen exchanger [Catenulispora acidiphila DSM 44928]|uniref:Sodium/hydrogen exchanger n=2 Tax=Catenulispora TaxID=414878 RepID=C7Q3K6_CATAD|nr:sodium/hydrogen exchanger [Catenulispora acidiphila DSM 44928]